MKVSAKVRDEVLPDIRREAAEEAEQHAYAAELDAARFERWAESSLAGASAAKNALAQAQEAAKVMRARATLRNRGVLDEDDLKRVRAGFLDRYILGLEKSYLRTQADIEALEELLAAEPDDESLTDSLERLQDTVKLQDLAHALAKEWRAPLRGNRAQRRKARSK